MSDQPTAVPDLRNHYRRLLTGAPPLPDDGVLESLPIQPAVDLSAAGQRERVTAARVTLLDVVDTHLDGDERLRQIARHLLDDEASGLALTQLRDADDLSELAQLESIVRTDGSRPSFMVRNGVVDRTTSPIGGWAPWLDASGDRLTQALGCVGRIDDPKQPPGFVGTGFLVQENLIVTNRHVLQAIASEHDGVWALKPNLRIDFGHEFKARASVRPRALLRVVFAGAKPILPKPIDHARLDLALIELAPSTTETRPETWLAINSVPIAPGAVVYVAGYPGCPYPGDYHPTLLEQLFQSTYGCKRVSPGETMPVDASEPAWKLNHDATTLGGNSGSVVLLAGEERASIALHYGGRPKAPAQNWAHELGRVFDERGSDGQTLRQHLEAHDVELTGG